ncbi:MAG: SGNH/GDSL hydrolase family protein [Pseudomonadales bacterium]|nr:SGNH/GDSL hydrolase family protein [Pseudomonadales bacterium]
MLSKQYALKKYASKITLQLLVLSSLFISLSGCMGESLCNEYSALSTQDQNNDEVIDYSVHVIGDSILAYHQISCKSVGHRLGLSINDKVLIKPVTGAKMREISQQYIPPKTNTDYELIIIDGGINDLIADENPGTPEETACNCNGLLNHNACLQEIDEITQQMDNIIDEVQATSSATVALLTYYPPEDDQSFIGACFPYVNQLNERYRQLANLDSRVEIIDTYGAGLPIIQKTSPLGADNYHPTYDGSEQLALLIQQQLGL